MNRVKFGVRKPRPLGLVKGESVRFDERDSKDLACDLKTVQLRETFYFLARSHTLGVLETQAEPMSDMRETLRQAAVANVVAAVSRQEDEQSAGIIGANLLGHEVTRAGSKLDLFQASDNVSGAGMLPYLQAGNSALPFVPPVPPNTATSPSAGQSLTSDRSKNVTRPRTFGEPEVNRQNRPQNTALANSGSRNKPHGDTKLPSLSASDSTAGSRKGNNSSRGQRSRVLRSHDLRTKLSDLSVSSYPLNTTPSNQFSPDDRSVASTVSCQDLIPGENSPGSSLHSDGSPTFAQPSLNSLDENSVKISEKPLEKRQKKTKKVSEISKCDAVDMHEPITSYVLKGAAPVAMLSAPNKDLFHATNGFKKRGLVNSSVSTMNESCDFSHGNSNTDTPEVTTVNYEAKKRNIYELGEGLKITSLTPIDLNSSEADLKFNPHMTFYSYALRHTPRGGSSSVVERYRQEEVLGKSRQPSLPAELLEIRHLALPSSSETLQVPVSKRKKIPAARAHKDKNNRRLFRTPSPTSQEEKSENADEEFSLVGQSLPSFPVNQESVRTFSLSDSFSFNNTDSIRVDAGTQPNSKHNQKNPQRHVNENQRFGDSTYKPNALLYNRKVGSRFMGTSSYKVDKNKEKPDEFLDMSKFSTVNRKSLWPRHDKPTSDDTCLEPVKSAPETSPVSNDNTDGVTTAEPLYMGFSSQASEPPSNIHHMAEENGDETKVQGNFKMFKALDQDVYSDFQHKKYRENSKLSFNTDKPRMHYIKIKVKDDVNR